MLCAYLRTLSKAVISKTLLNTTLTFPSKGNDLSEPFPLDVFSTHSAYQVSSVTSAAFDVA